MTKTHRQSKTPTYRIWCRMRRRCNPNFVKDHPYYSGRGIKVCEAWGHFENFLADMGKKPGPGYSIDRIDPNGDYSPENCRWSTHVEQCNNRRSNVLITIDGRTQNITQWATEYGLSHKLVWRRLQYGWPPLDALTIPVGSRHGSQWHSVSGEASERAQMRMAGAGR
jgi:hypothetical protein